jgi:glycosyltransferase involved in cell wall biosynthesis
VSTSQLRIVHVIARLNVGGAARSVIELAAEERRRMHDVVVVAGSLAPGEDSMEYLAVERGVPVLSLPSLQRELSPRQDARAIRSLRRLLRERRPHVLHTHTAKAGATGRLAALLTGDARPPAIVHTFHGHVLSGYFSPGRERIFQLVERALAGRTSTLIAVSEEVRDDLVGFGVARAERFAVVPYGFELSTLGGEERRAALRAELGIGDGAFVVGFAGRLTPIKRPLDLVRTLAELRAGGIDASLIVVGDGPERPRAEGLASAMGIAGHCRFLGYRRDIEPWYSAFDAFLLVSQNEGAPVVAIEALAAGRPVVATNAGGTRTIVKHGLSGFLAPIGDTAALAAHLATLARDPDLAERLAAYGAADVRVRFSLERMAADVEALYRKALER